MLWLGALGDRYGRKLMLVLGTALAIPFSLLAALAPSDTVLFVARVGGGLAAGMAYPTTLALITALWAPGAGRTKAIALWSGLGGAVAALGPLLSGLLLEHFYWGSVFFLTLPLAVVAVVMAWKLVPAHVNEDTEPVDNIGGLLSLVLVGSLILAINFAPVPNAHTLKIVLTLIAIVALVLFYVRQRRAKNPLYDLEIASRPPFWVAACAGIIVFGSLMGAMFIGQQFLQNVLGYSTFQAGALDPAGGVLHGAGRSPLGQDRRGTRGPLYPPARLRVRAAQLPDDAAPLEGGHPVLEGRARLRAHRHRRRARRDACVALPDGVCPREARRHGVRNRRPAARPRRRGHAVDLRRAADRGLCLGRVVADRASGKHVSDSVASQLTKSFDGAQAIAQEYPAYSSQITAAAKTSFLHGDQWAYTAGIVAVLLGAVLVFFFFPKAERERELLTSYAAEDAA